MMGTKMSKQNFFKRPTPQLVILASMLIALIALFIFSKSIHSQDTVAGLTETLTYGIKKFGIRVGEATIEYTEEFDLGGKKAVQIIFTAKGIGFFDQEKIYADPKTMLPLRVERDLDLPVIKEHIVEYYDPQKNIVEIVKSKKGKKVDTVQFKRDHPIDNLYCFIYRYRRNGIFAEGEKFQMNLPTKDVSFEIVRREKNNFYKGADEAWFMESRPSEYRVWFGTQDPKLPLRIDGAVGMAKTAMILEDYQSNKIE